MRALPRTRSCCCPTLLGCSMARARQPHNDPMFAGLKKAFHADWPKPPAEQHQARKCTAVRSSPARLAGATATQLGCLVLLMFAWQESCLAGTMEKSLSMPLGCRTLDSQIQGILFDIVDVRISKFCTCRAVPSKAASGFADPNFDPQRQTFHDRDFAPGWLGSKLALELKCGLWAC